MKLEHRTEGLPCLAGSVYGRDHVYPEDRLRLREWARKRPSHACLVPPLTPTQLVKHFCSEEQWMREGWRAKPDVVLLDVSLREIKWLSPKKKKGPSSFLELIFSLFTDFPQCPVSALTYSASFPISPFPLLITPFTLSPLKNKLKQPNNKKFPQSL